MIFANRDMPRSHILGCSVLVKKHATADAEPDGNAGRHAGLLPKYT
jgi:hypothetical protein